MGVEVRGGAVTVPTVAGFILSALESSGERATLRSHQCVDSACGERHAESGGAALVRMFDPHQGSVSASSK